MGYINPLTPLSLCQRLVSLRLKAKPLWQNIISSHQRRFGNRFLLLSFLPSFLVPLKEKGGREGGRTRGWKTGSEWEMRAGRQGGKAKWYQCCYWHFTHGTEYSGCSFFPSGFLFIAHIHWIPFSFNGRFLSFFCLFFNHIPVWV